MVARNRTRELSYYEVLSAAIADLTKNGFDSAERVAFWSAQIREAAERMIGTEDAQAARLRDALGAAFQRMIEGGEIARYNGGVDRYTLERLRPELRAELDRRIMASASLIRINRDEAIEKTLQRFVGWATSIPQGGSKSVDKAAEKKNLKKALANLPYVERRVLIDQGHKLSASVSEVVARGSGAIAGTWHSHWRQEGYDYRPDHKERDQGVYLLKSSWAKDRGLVKPGPAGYYEDITAVGEEPFCQCYVVWIHNVRSLPADMITARGRAELERVAA